MHIYMCTYYHFSEERHAEQQSDMRPYSAHQMTAALMCKRVDLLGPRLGERVPRAPHYQRRWYTILSLCYDIVYACYECSTV